MFALLRNLPLSSRTCRPCTIVHNNYRALSTTAARKAEIVDDPSVQASDVSDGKNLPEDDEDMKGFDEAFGEEEKKDNRDPPFKQWLETVGKRFKEPFRPRNWLGGQVPFPLNPSFKPPTPISDELRTLIYTQYMVNPEGNSVRVLAERYGLSMKRIDAILRLKGLEEHWKKGKQLQTGFQAGMEETLGVTEDKRVARSLTRGADELGEDTSAADWQAEAEGSNAARDRYQRMFWEPVVEGQDAVVFEALELARAHAQKHKQISEQQKNDPKLLGARHDTIVVDKVKVVVGQDRPSVMFVDVGGKFLDVKDRLRRMKEAERRAKIKTKKREEKKHMLRSRSTGAAANAEA